MSTAMRSQFGLALVFAASLSPHAQSPPTRAELPPAVAPSTGAWIWTRADAEQLDRARVVDPALRAAVHVATIERHPDGNLAWRRALSPDVRAAAGGGVAAVVRFDDSLHAAWGDSERELEGRLAPILGRILEEGDATGARIDEVQLDYDAPVRDLASWARVVDALGRGVLSGREVWVTSIPAQLEADSYGALFAHSGVGHILQVFDTGIACTPENAAHVAKRLLATGLRFRVGVAAFERTSRPGAHACWRAEASRWRLTPGYAGLWVFPAGHDIRPLLGLDPVQP
jgi:hypothetical protein